MSLLASRLDPLLRDLGPVAGAAAHAAIDLALLGALYSLARPLGSWLTMLSRRVAHEPLQFERGLWGHLGLLRGDPQWMYYFFSAPIAVGTAVLTAIGVTLAFEPLAVARTAVVLVAAIAGALIWALVIPAITPGDRGG